VILDPILDRFRGKAVTIPPMDGALRPNTLLDDCEIAVEAETPDNLCSDGERVLFSSGPDVYALPQSRDEKPSRISRHEAPVGALAAAYGMRATALDDGRIIVQHGNREQTFSAPDGFACPTALAFADAGTLLICHGSSRHRASDWVVDLMEKNAAGSVWKLDIAAGSQTCLARDLAFPYGVLVTSNSLIVSEAWRHRLIRLSPAGNAPEPVLTKLPGYPARLSAASDGGAWLALFAPRNRLIEFVLRENAYRTDMMREVPRDCWIAPALASEASFLEPLQCGGVKTMGIHKPWSPCRSYGLVARLDDKLRPVASFHSRANGTRHGITSMVEVDKRLLASAKGAGAILSVASES
jgi:hypothetical protein